MIGDRIREIRDSRQWTLEDLAAAIGSPNAAGQLSKIERGLATPSIGRLNAIADALGVPVAALTLSGGGGFAEPEVALLPPPTPGDNTQALDYASLAPDVSRPMLYHLMRGSFGHAPGTILVLDQDDSGRDGDLVLVQVEDREHGFAETRLLRRLGNHLIGPGFAHDPSDCARIAPRTHFIKGRIAATAWAPQIEARRQICA